METLDDELFFESIKGEGDPVVFSEEELIKSRKRWTDFAIGESEIEATVRKERASAALTPSVPLTF